MINIKLFLERKDIPVKIDVVQDTNAIPISFHIADYQIPEGTEARIYLRKPSGAEVYNSAAIDENAVIVQPTTQMYAEDGEALGQLQIIKDTTVAASFAIVFCIHKNIISDSAIESKDEFGILDTLINQAREEIKNAQNATSAANTAAESATTAANAANTGAEAATSAAESATTAADAANAGAEAATSAAMSANAAADRANEAAGNIEQANIKPLAYSVSGESITAGNSAEKPLIGLTVHGRADQGSTTGAQLFNKSTVTPESYVRDTDGTVVASTTHPTCASDYITLDGAESIYITSTMTSNRWGAFYNDKKEYVSGIAGYSSPITVPVGAVYIRLTVADDNLDTFMVNTGSTALPYEPYTYGVPSPSVEYPQAIDIAGLGWATGAQLWDAGDVVITSRPYAEANLSVPLQPGTYTITADVTSSDTDSDTCLLYDYGNRKGLGQFKRGLRESITFTTDVAVSNFGFYNGKDHTASVDDTSSFKNIMLNAGSSALPWEPYTGGKQEYYEKGIEVDVMGANLFDISKVQSISGASGSQTTNNNDGTLLVQSSQGDSSGGYEDGKNVLRDLCPELRVGDVAVLSAKSTGSDKRIYLRGSKSPWTFGISRTISETDLDSIVMFYAAGTSTSATISEIMINAGSVALPYEPYKTPQSVSLSTPNGLAGLKVSSGGNYTDASGQQWICDEIVRNERGTGKRIQRIGIIESYASETINTAYMSTTGQLTEGATVIYALDDAIETDLTAEEIAALSALHTYYPTMTITNDAGCDMTAAYVTQYYQGVGDAMFYGVADNLTTEKAGTSVLDAHQGKVLDNKIGALTDLETTAKSSAVAAINEVKSETVSLIPTVLFDSPTRVGSGTFAESIYNFERIRIYYKIRYEYGSVDIYTSFISTDGVVDLIGFFDFNNYLGAHLHRINLTDTTFSTVYAYQYFPPSTEKTDVGGDDAIAIYRVEGYRS